MTDHFRFELEQEEDGRWLCECVDLPGCMVYAECQIVALTQAYKLAQWILENLETP